MSSAWKWLLLAAALVAAIVIVRVLAHGVRSALFYRRLFAAKHYQEVASELAQLRDAAAQRIRPEGTTDDPDLVQRTVTSGSLAIAYSIVSEESELRHHLSVSTPQRGHTTHAAGQTFVSFFVWRLGIEPSDCESWFGPYAYHLEFVLEEVQAADFLARPTELPAEVDIERIRHEVLAIREQIDFFDAREAILEADAARATYAPSPGT